MRKILLAMACLMVGTFNLPAQDFSDTNFRPRVNVSLTQSTLPLVFITVDGQTIRRDSKILGHMRIVNNENGVNYRDLKAHPDQRIDWEGPITIKYRGNSSFNNSRKKPFSIRPLKEAQLDAKKEKVAILGMGKDNDWVLLAPWEDKSYMRDVLSMELARGGHVFAPRMKYCEVILDGTYYGLYIMSERATKGKERLNLNDPGTDGDLTGDYHIEVDRDDEAHFYQSRYAPVTTSGQAISNKRITFQYKEPEYEDFATLPAGTETALRREIDKMEDALASADYKNPETGYRKYIDVASFIDYEIAQELANNVDGYRLSTPLYKYGNTHAAALGDNAKWKMALWDFNIAYGVANYYNTQAEGIWRYKANDVMQNADNQLIPFWWRQLMNDEAYVNELKMRWLELRGSSYSDRNIRAKIDSLQSVLVGSGALGRDNMAWDYQFGQIADNVSTLKDYISRRLAFLDRSWMPAAPLPSMDGYRYQPLPVASGYNADCLVENRPASTHATASLDDSGWCLYTTAVQTAGGVAGEDGVLTSDKGVAYRLGDYAANNVLSMKGGVSAGELTLTEPVSVAAVYYLVLGADGSSDLSVTINYTDGSSSAASVSHVADWFSTSADGTEAKYGLGRISRSASGNIDGRLNFRLYESYIKTDEQKQVKSVSFCKTGGHPAILALSGVMRDSSAGIGQLQNGQSAEVRGIYTPAGMKISRLQRGVNILKMADGSSRKVVLP